MARGIVLRGRIGRGAACGLLRRGRADILSGVPKISAETLEKHRAETIDKLIDSFGRLVMEQGYADVSLADVAQDVGLARTAIYNYFPDRESLLFAWTDREVVRAIEAMKRQIDEAPDSATKLRVFVRLQLADFASRHLPPGQEVIQFLKPETYGRFMQHIEPIERLLRGILAYGSETGEFGAVNHDDVVPLVMACVGSERGPLAAGAHDVEEATNRVTDFVLRALDADASAGTKRPVPRKRASRDAGSRSASGL